MITFSPTDKLEDNITSPLTDNISSITTLLFVYNVSWIDNVDDKYALPPIDNLFLTIKLLPTDKYP